MLAICYLLCSTKRGQRYRAANYRTYDASRESKAGYLSNHPAKSVRFESCLAGIIILQFNGLVGGHMRNTLRLLLLVIALVLIGNFVILRLYGDTLQSTHLFIVRGTVFYPIALLNLILGILLITFLVWEWLSQRKSLK